MRLTSAVGMAKIGMTWKNKMVAGTVIGDDLDEPSCENNIGKVWHMSTLDKEVGG